jgi:hypothetical protein
MVIDQNASTGGISSLVKCSSYLFALKLVSVAVYQCKRINRVLDKIAAHAKERPRSPIGVLRSIAAKIVRPASH